MLPTSSRRRLHRVTPALAEPVSELECSQHDGTVAVGTEITGVAAEVSSTVSVGSQTVEANEAVLVQDMVDVWSAPGFMNTAAATVVFEFLPPSVAAASPARRTVSALGPAAGADLLCACRSITSVSVVNVCA